MKLKFFILLLVLNYSSVFSQVDTTVVPFVSYWSLGDSYDFKITKIKKQWKSDELVKNDSGSYNVNFLVQDSTATSYTIKWSYRTNLSELGLPPEILPNLSKIEKTDVIYKTSEVGEFLEIENWEEISAQMTSIVNEVIELMSKEYGDDFGETMKSMRPFLEIYESQEGIEQLVLKELQYFHFPFGLEYSVDQPILYQEELPNMLGGDPIPADVKLYFAKVDFENEYCELVKEMTVNSEGAKNMIMSFLARLDMDKKEMKEIFDEALFEINDVNIFKYYYYPGVPLEITSTREIIFKLGTDESKKVEISRIELLN